MNIVVCIKQVPDVDDIKWTKENNLDRTQMLSKLNPYDEWALDFAIKFKNKFKDVSLTVITMGPNQAKEILNYSLAKGATRAILLSDKFFAGSDTLATAKILSSAIKKYIPDFDIILTGQMAIDGDTAQTPVSIAQLLNISDIENVIDIVNADKNQVTVSQKLYESINIIETKTPVLIAINNECDQKANAKIDDYIRAQNAPIEVYCAEDLGLDKTQIGIIGSPTTVYRAFRNEINKDTVEIEADFAKKILELTANIQK